MKQIWKGKLKLRIGNAHQDISLAADIARRYYSTGGAGPQAYGRYTQTLY